MKNDATHPYSYQRNEGCFSVLRNDTIKRSMLSVAFGGFGSCSVWMTDEELSTLVEMLSDCLETSKPLFTEVT